MNHPNTTTRSDAVTTLCAALFGFYGVAAGAAASHAMADALAAERLSTAALYALIHAAVLLAWRGGGWLHHSGRVLMMAGVVLFCGSLTLVYGFGIGTTALAPIGGMLLLAAWAILAAKACQTALRRKPHA